jgi:DNA processing protein
MQACARCLRRSWLVAALGGPLDYVSRDGSRLIAALALDDDDLLRALGGRRRAQLRSEYDTFELAPRASGDTAHAMCCHAELYPAALRFNCAPRALHVTPEPPRLAELAASPVVAVLGTSRASDYGIGVARDLARGLAAAGITVAAELRDGIAAAALAGAVDAGGRAVCALSNGVHPPRTGTHRALHARVLRTGCAVSELPPGAPARRWSQIASSRLPVGLAELTVIVEAEDSRRDLVAASLANTLGRRLGAVPGRVTSPASRGANELLAGGAAVVRGADDVLELVSVRAAACSAAVRSAQDRNGPQRATRQPARDGRDGLQPQLRRVLDRVGAGCDTPERLQHELADVHALLQALSELELMGLLVRGDGGRYLPTPTARA